MGRARIVLAMVVLVAAGMGVFVFLRERDEDALRTEAAPVTDASADAHSKAAKAKPTIKKKAARGGKTRVTARPSGGAGAGGTHGGGGGGGGGTHGGGAPTNNAHEGAEDGHHDQGGAQTPPPNRPHKHYAGPSGPSYESALDSNNHQLTMGAHTGADLTDAQLSAPMSDGTFVDECDAPESMGVTVKVAIKMGRAVGVSVSTSPPSADVAGCIDHHVRRLSWPVSPKMDSFVTTY